MMKGSSLTRVVVLTAFSAGLIIYLLGLVVGFFQASTVYMFYWYTSGSYTLIPVFQFEVYPRFILAVSPLPFYIDRLSPLTLIFLAFTVSAVVSTYLKKHSIAVLLSTSAFLTAVTQFIVLTPIVGGSPSGLAANLFVFSGLYPLPFIVVFSSKSLYLIILSAFLLGTGMFALIAMLHREEVALVSATPISGEHFNSIKSFTTRIGVLLVPPYIFLFLQFFLVQLYLTEFLHYPLLVFYLEVFEPYPIDFEFFLVFFLVFHVPLLGSRSSAINRLAEICVPLLARKLDKQKPVISLLEVKEKLGLESADKRVFKQVLMRAKQLVEKKGTIYFGVVGNQLYLKEPLSLMVREKISNQGKADISEIASEIQVDPKLLRTIYSRLRRERLLENVRILKNMITPLRTAESP